jgi:hypothetical protein
MVSIDVSPRGFGALQALSYRQKRFRRGDTNQGDCREPGIPAQRSRGKFPDKQKDKQISEKAKEVRERYGRVQRERGEGGGKPDALQSTENGAVPWRDCR